MYDRLFTFYTCTLNKILLSIGEKLWKFIKFFLRTILPILIGILSSLGPIHIIKGEQRWITFLIPITYITIIIIFDKDTKEFMRKYKSLSRWGLIVLTCYWISTIVLGIVSLIFFFSKI